MNRVLVTGVTGKSGVYFLNELREHPISDAQFDFIVRNPEKAEQIAEMFPNSTVHEGDLNDRAFLNRIFTGGGYNTLLHIAGISYSPFVVPAAVEHGIDWLILVHTTGIYSKYKAAGEGYRQIEEEIDRLIQGRKIALTILRPTMIYGNLNDRNISVFIKMVDKLRVFPTVKSGEYELQPVWCGDLGKAYHQVLTHAAQTRGRSYNLSGGAPIQLIDMFRVIASYLGVKNVFVPVPFFIAYGGAWALFLLTLGRVDYRERVQRMVEPRVFSHADAARDFGYEPVDFATGVKAEVEAYRGRS